MLQPGIFSSYCRARGYKVPADVGENHLMYYDIYGPPTLYSFSICPFKQDLVLRGRKQLRARGKRERKKKEERTKRKSGVKRKNLSRVSYKGRFG